MQKYLRIMRLDHWIKQVQISTSIRAAYIHDSYNYKWTPWNPKLAWNSFKDKDISLLSNFLVSDYEKKAFFKYFAKK